MSVLEDFHSPFLVATQNFGYALAFIAVSVALVIRTNSGDADHNKNLTGVLTPRHSINVFTYTLKTHSN